jgi:RNA polymerase II subunit A small phosphatase-like protein
MMEHDYCKDLRKVRNHGFPVERVLVVDDSPSTLGQNYGNHVPIKPFEGDMTDDELQRLWPHLAKWATQPNVREIDKYHWRWAPDWL